MERVFLFVLNNAITVSALIIAIIIVRALGKKMPKWITCMLWMIVAVKLIVPVQFESVFSMIPTGEPISVNNVVGKSMQIVSGSKVMELYFKMFHVGMLLWLVGVAVMLTYAVTTYVLIRKKVSASVKIDSKVYECDDISDSFILGIISPRVYLPSALSGEARKYILKHEFAHLSRRDYIWKPLGFAILSVYWFNPLCWVAYILLCKDIEYACDEKVTKNIENGEKAEYCRILLENSVPGKMIAACPVAFGGIDVKDRIKNVVNYKKPAFWITIASIMVCIAVGVCFATNKGSKTVDEQQMAEAEQQAAVEQNTADQQESQIQGNDQEDVSVKTEQNGDLMPVSNVEDAAASVDSIPEGAKLVGLIETPEGVLKVRQAPGDDAECIGYLAPDEVVDIIEEADGWYKIKLDEGEGYIKSDYVNIGWVKDVTNSESN
ncbi:M56 family metallopeptidase [Butyrivibrio sp. M55]|uniref:M56 family metallopeptidase n=1 Tax=Butyrivibrio sp. M55 TaxID=1855323 RepID=UPI0008E02E3D|nr:M56 family metallopeptidase [Butyrivibrio sp. M55]SFU74432.1 Signal transducer regulating beta-lactamase production, contains metallopeptidase domain [Butyrivibrio sp. M55]